MYSYGYRLCAPLCILRHWYDCSRVDNAIIWLLCILISTGLAFSLFLGILSGKTASEGLVTKMCKCISAGFTTVCACVWWLSRVTASVFLACLRQTAWPFLLTGAGCDVNLHWSVSPWWITNSEANTKSIKVELWQHRCSAHTWCTVLVIKHASSYTCEVQPVQTAVTRMP